MSVYLQLVCIWCWCLCLEKVLFDLESLGVRLRGLRSCSVCKKIEFHGVIVGNIAQATGTKRLGAEAMLGCSLHAKRVGLKKEWA